MLCLTVSIQRRKIHFTKVGRSMSWLHNCWLIFLIELRWKSLNQGDRICLNRLYFCKIVFFRVWSRAFELSQRLQFTRAQKSLMCNSIVFIKRYEHTNNLNIHSSSTKFTGHLNFTGIIIIFIGFVWQRHQNAIKNRTNTIREKCNYRCKKEKKSEPNKHEPLSIERHIAYDVKDTGHI